MYFPASGLSLRGVVAGFQIAGVPCFTLDLNLPGGDFRTRNNHSILALREEIIRGDRFEILLGWGEGRISLDGIHRDLPDREQ